VIGATRELSVRKDKDHTKRGRNMVGKRGHTRSALGSSAALPVCVGHAQKRHDINQAEDESSKLLKRRAAGARRQCISRAQEICIGTVDGLHLEQEAQATTRERGGQHEPKEAVVKQTHRTTRLCYDWVTGAQSPTAEAELKSHQTRARARRSRADLER
jgi:hypothetical protein